MNDEYAKPTAKADEAVAKDKANAECKALLAEAGAVKKVLIAQVARLEEIQKRAMKVDGRFIHEVVDGWIHDYRYEDYLPNAVKELKDLLTWGVWSSCP